MAKRVAATQRVIDDLTRQSAELLRRMNNLKMYSPEWEELARQLNTIQAHRAKLYAELKRQQSSKSVIKEIKK